MTPEEMQELIKKTGFVLSQISFISGVDRARIARYVNGDTGSLEPEEIARLNERFDLSGAVKAKNLTEYEHLSEGSSKYVVSHSVFCSFENSGEGEIASGTLVTIQGRLFVCTCAHAIPRRTNYMTIGGDNTVEIRKNQETGSLSAESTKIVRVHRHDTLDIGFLEIDPSTIDTLKRLPLSLDGISTREPQAGRMAFFVGFPRALKKLRRSADGAQEVLISSLTYPAPVLSREEWPAVPPDSRPGQIGVDVFLPYKQKDSTKRVLMDRSGKKTETLDSLPDVHGMSGGGIWQSWEDPFGKELWFPSHYKLCAIQFSWYSPENYVRAIGIRHWLELVAEHYPDLTADISHKFVTEQR